MDLIVLAALGLALVGIAGSVVPGLPGPFLSLAAVYLYWWHSGFTDPGPVLLAALTAVGVFAVVTDWVSGFVSARAGGAHWTTALVAGVVGIVLFIVTTPLGALIGVPLTVFALEYWRSEDHRHSGRAAAVTTVGILGSAVVQVTLTAVMFVTLLVLAL